MTGLRPVEIRVAIFETVAFVWFVWFVDNLSFVHFVYFVVRNPLQYTPPMRRCGRP
jgi:hypothetical protein